MAGPVSVLHGTEWSGELKENASVLMQTSPYLQFPCNLHPLFTSRRVLYQLFPIFANICRACNKNHETARAAVQKGGSAHYRSVNLTRLRDVNTGWEFSSRDMRAAPRVHCPALTVCWGKQPGRSVLCLRAQSLGGKKSQGLRSALSVSTLDREVREGCLGELGYTTERQSLCDPL